MSVAFAPSDAPDQVLPGAAETVRLAAISAIAANAALPIIEMWRMIAAGEPGSVRFALFATAATLALHLRHVVYGLRNERPPAAAWTLSILALVHVLALAFVGRAWGLQIPALMVSILLVAPGPVAFAVVALLAFVPSVLLGAGLPLWQPVSSPMLTGSGHLVMALIWRTTTLYVTVRLVNTIQQLEATRREVEARAVQQTRAEADRDIRGSVGVALERIISRGEAANARLSANAPDVDRDIERLAADARVALSDARRVIAGYQKGALRGELDAASALLAAAGSAGRVEISEGVALHATTDESRKALRDAVIRALEMETQTPYSLLISRDDRGELDVQLRFDGRPASEDA